MSRSKRDKRQIEAKQLRRKHGTAPEFPSFSGHPPMDAEMDAKFKELHRLNAFQFDEMHNGLWAFLRKRAKRLFKRKKADITFKEQLKEM